MELRYTRGALRDMRAIRDRAVRERLRVALEGLVEDPYLDGAKKLSGRATIWRIRVGDWRICYTVENERLIVLILTVARRGDVYERLHRRVEL